MAEVDPQKAKQDAEIADLKAQIAQLSAGLSGQNLLQFGNQIQGPLSPPPQTGTGALTPVPTGLTGLPGAGQFGPQGVMFAGGSPWPVNAHPANTQNGIIAATMALNTLQRLGLLNKLFSHGQQAPQGQPAAASPDVTNLALDQLWK